MQLYVVFTGRNEVLAKVIFSQASVCPRGVSKHALQVSPGGSIFLGWGGFSNFGGVSPIFWGLQFFGGVSPIFWGGAVKGTPQFFGGGIFFLISAFFGDTPPPDQTLEHGQRLAGMHPTGMHSCWLIILHVE